MQFDIEMAEKIKRYLSDVYDLQLTINEILRRPRWKRVYYWWKALEYFEGSPLPNMSIEEIKSIYGDDSYNLKD